MNLSSNWKKMLLLASQNLQKEFFACLQHDKKLTTMTEHLKGTANGATLREYKIWIFNFENNFSFFGSREWGGGFMLNHMGDSRCYWGKSRRSPPNGLWKSLKFRGNTNL